MNNSTFKRYVNAIVAGTIAPVVDVAIDPVSPDAPLAPVVDVALTRKPDVAYRQPDVSSRDDRHPDDYDGSACSSGCGYCGRCTDGINTNCLCADCGLAFWRGPEDCDNFCDGCRDIRDAHTTALEVRMAKAAIPADVKKEVA